MQFISTTFKTPFRSAQSYPTPLQPAQEKVSVLSVTDIRIEIIDEQSRKILSSVDLRTDPSSGLYSESDLKTKWICRNKNFFLGETKGTHYIDGEVRKVSEYGYTIPDKTASFHQIDQKPGERYFNAYRNVSSWDKEAGIYENTDDIANFKEFCRVCNVERVVYPPKSKE